MSIPIRVLIVDDHEMVRRGLSTYLMTEENIELVGEATNGVEAVALAKKEHPDVILMDLVMDTMDGVTATQKIKKFAPDIKVIVLTSYINDDKVFPAIEAGAFSYLLKTARAEEILEAIYAAHRGEARIEPQVTSKMISRMQRTKPLHEELTKREREVLLLLGEAKTNQQIAEELFIGVKTVKTHVSNILAKLGLEDRTQAAVYAVKNGLVDHP